MQLMKNNFRNPLAQVLLGSIISFIIMSQVAFAAVLTISEGNPNPLGGFERLFMISGEANDSIDGITIPDSLQPLFSSQRPNDIQLRLFHFNDLHGHLTIANKMRGDTHYFSQMVNQVKKARDKGNQNEVILFLSAGDDHIGSVFDELYGFDLKTFSADPMYRAYSAAGVDAVALGNHEFDRGTLLLSHALQTEARFPALSANIRSSDYLKLGQYYPAVIGMAKGLKVGIIGLTTAQDTHVNNREDRTFALSDPFESVQRILPHVAALSDVVIILSHIGYEEQASNFNGRSDAELVPLARSLTSKPLIIVGGHSHTVLNKNSMDVVKDGVPVFQAGNRGQYMGEAVLSFEEQGINVDFAQLLPLKKRDNRIKADDAKYATLEQDQDYDQKFEASVIQPLLDKLAIKLNESIATVDLIPELSTEKVALERYMGECLMANFMNDAILERSVNFALAGGRKADIALMNASGVNSGIAIGTSLTFNDWYQVMPFADSIQVGKMTGRQIKEMVISNAKRIVRPAELLGDKPLNLSGYFARGFLHFSSGLRYTIKLGANANETTAITILLHGKPIEEVLDETYLVAFNSFVGDGAYNEAWNGATVGAGISGNINGFNIKALPKSDTGLIYRNEIVAFIRSQGVISTSDGARFDGRVSVIP